MKKVAPVTFLRPIATCSPVEAYHYTNNDPDFFVLTLVRETNISEVFAPEPSRQYPVIKFFINVVSSELLITPSFKIRTWFFIYVHKIW